ncbi:MAG: DHH family phosphoesterase [Nitrospira bacterium HGW-Nitrospira-1]|nr:MAG: DHH family phosphoesterase [Nitrospira bacterium HGW-Nitrospira-1]
MKIPKEIISVLNQEKAFLIATHINPDGDAIGSALALSSALESLGKEVHVYNKDRVPEFYRFMPGHKRFRRGMKNALIKKPVLILLDCNSPERAALEQYSFRKSVVIDHHETERDFGDIRWVVPSAAATGLMIFYLLKAMGITSTADISTNLYTAIAGDTGTFRYNNTSPEVLTAGAELIKTGANPALIAECLYEQWARNRFDLLVMTLNNLEIKNDVAVIHITKDMFCKTDTIPEDTESFSNFPRMIKSVKISALFRDIGDGCWKASLRSKGDVNVAKIAELYGGGGHRNAAGFKVRGSLQSVKEQFLRAAKKLAGN